MYTSTMNPELVQGELYAEMIPSSESPTPVSQKPSKEVYVVRNTEQKGRLQYYDSEDPEYCRELYGTRVKVNEGGLIFYHTWPQVDRKTVESDDFPKNYTLVSQEREPSDTYLQRPLTTKTLHELRINIVKGEDQRGSVESGIRGFDAVIARQILQRNQMTVARERVNELFDLFSDWSSITDEQLTDAQRRTIQRLNSVQFNPQTVRLESKREIADLLQRASAGIDSIGRRNPLIKAKELEAIYRRCSEREFGLDNIEAKFWEMRQALRIARDTSRRSMTNASELLRSMPYHVVFRFPDNPPKKGQTGILNERFDTIIFNLKQPLVLPYRSVSRDVADIVGLTRELMNEGNREHIAFLVTQSRNMLEQTLTENADIYPNQSDLP